jgi:flagellar biosynthesis protein FliQ
MQSVLTASIKTLVSSIKELEPASTTRVIIALVITLVVATILYSIITGIVIAISYGVWIVAGSVIRYVPPFILAILAMGTIISALFGIVGIYDYTIRTINKIFK